MKRKLLALLLTIGFFPYGFAQSQDTTLITITDFKLFPGTFSWRGTNTFYDMTSWDSRPYTEGHLKQLNGSKWVFRMNYRLLLPAGHDPNFKPGYPIIIMLHGGGERANCWNDNCYCKDCEPNATPDPGANPAFLNNDHVLLHGGPQHLNAVNAAGSKKPGDPTLSAAAFPGFVLFPQNDSGWGNPESGTSEVSYALRILRLIIKQYNIDQDRIYIHGLSAGGQGVYKALNMANWLFAAAATMSAIPYVNSLQYNKVATIPLWAFQGGLDTNPRPSQTEALLKKFREAGGTARYTFYPERGHNTWGPAYREPDFFSWFLSKRKNDIHVFYTNANICTTTGKGAKLGVAKGFAAYQWERDGKIIADAKSAILIADTPGKYRVRFSRKSANPSESEWNAWSNFVTVTANVPETPVMSQSGTTYLRDLNGEKDAFLSAPPGYAHYYWYNNDKLTNLEDSSNVVVKPGNCGSPCANTGRYTVSVAGLDSCPSLPSFGKYLFFENQAPVNNGMRPTTFNFELTSSSSCFLKWDDPTESERAYELWRINTSQSGSKWELATITDRNANFYHDTTLIPNSIYYYKIRAINSTARSDYFPGNDKVKTTDNLVVKTANENLHPMPPQNLKASLVGFNAVKLMWEASKNWDLKEYVIVYDDQTIPTGSTSTTYTVSNLSPNRSYQFTVKSVNTSNYQSTPSNQVSVHTNMQGLFYKHSTGGWTSLNDESINETWQSPEETGKVENFTLAPRVQEDYFNFQFEGYLYISTAGAYAFYLNSNDGSRLFIDDVQYIDFDGVHGLCSGDALSTTCPNSWGKPSDRILLSAGYHYIKVQMFEYTGSQDLFVRYNGPDTGNSTVLIPSTALTSGTYSPPPSPTVPTNVKATAKGMTQIDVAWQASSGTQYEVYRSTKLEGPFSIITRVATLTYADVKLTPGTTYYYRVRAVNNNGVSSYSAIVNAKTQSDTEPPSRPEELEVSGTRALTNLVWKSSTDNVGVAGYEIWANGKKIGVSKVPGFTANLDDIQTFTFYVVAFDASGNRSPASATVTNEKLVTDTEENNIPNFYVSIYPNPVLSRDVNIQVVTADQQTISVQIKDVMGRSIFTETYEANALQDGFILRLPDMKNGLYIFTIQQQNKLLERKVVISNNH